MSNFKVPFNIDDYSDILPSLDEYLEKDYVLNFDELVKGNIENCIWKKHIATPDEIKSQEFKERELRRILKSGVYAAIKDTVLWIPPQMYWNLNYTKISGVDPEFRLKRLMNYYFKIRCIRTPHCKGWMICKSRQDGETFTNMSDSFWETFNMEDGQITISSKTRSDAINPCWKTMQAIYMGTPRWLFDLLFGDCETNGKNIAETIKFLRFADETKNVNPKNVLIAYYPSVYNALDGKNTVRIANGDEFLKWIECDFGAWFNNASKFLMPGFQRSGVFSLFSSPPEKDSQSYRDGYELWNKSDITKLGNDGTTESRIHRYYSNPLHGIQGAYDQWGDADPEKIYAWIMAERKRMSKDKLLEEVRGFPLTDEEIWGSLEGGQAWSNQKGLQKRQVFLIGRRFKDEQTKEPVVVRGNLEWKEGVPDHPEGVQFRQSDKTEFDVHEARFAFTVLPQRLHLQPLKNIYYPPDYPEIVAGVDPFGKRIPGKRASDGAITVYKFRDVAGTGINKMPIGLYLNRPFNEDIFHEDVLKVAIFCQAKIQFESNVDKLSGFFINRGYREWLIPAIGETRNTEKYGDHIPSSGKFIDEIIGLIDAYLNIPVNPEDECLLERIWFEELVTDLLKFNVKDRHENDATSSFGMALIGAAKLSLQKVRQKSKFNDAALSYLLS